MFHYWKLELQGRQNWGGARKPRASSLLSIAKIKKRNKGKKESVSRQNLFKGCYESQNITVLAILERLELKNIAKKKGNYGG